MVGVLKVKVVRLDQLKFVNNGTKQKLTSALHLYDIDNKLRFMSVKHALVKVVTLNF